MRTNILADVQPQYNFIVCDGKVVKNIQELHSALQKMSEETYKYHANREKNDFANWISDILKDAGLAQRIRTSSSKQEAAKILEKVISTVKKK